MIPFVLLLGIAQAAPVEVARADRAHVQRPVWSPDGRWLAWEANAHEAKKVTLYVGPAEGPFQPVHPATTPQSAFSAGFTSARRVAGISHEIAWSPANPGTYVYAATGSLGDLDLHISGGAALAPAPGADGGATWSPDGRTLAFTSARTGEGDLYLLDTTRLTSPPRRLTHTPTAAELFPAWSPTHGALAWIGHGPTGDELWWLPTPDGQPERLLGSPGTRLRPRWSPDGRHLAFYESTDRSGRVDLVVLEAGAPGSARVLLEGVLPDASGPSWSPDGRQLVVVQDDDARFDPIVVVPLAGGAPVALDLGTVGHGDLDLVEREGRCWLAWVAQGRVEDEVRDFKRLFVAQITLPGN